MLTSLNSIYHKYIDIQYKILLRIFLYLFPKETPKSTDEKLSKIKAGSAFLMKKYLKIIFFLIAHSLRLVIYLFVLIQCYGVGIFCHLVLYYLLIPSVNQEVALNFSKSKELHSFLFSSKLD